MSQDIYKAVLVGESGVGKTCIVAQFINGKFDPDTISSYSAQFIRKTLEFADGQSIILDIWDTAGQEVHRSIAKLYYKDAKVVILVYDITSLKSFNEMKDYWYQQVKDSSGKDVILAIAANKSDLYNERQVDDEVAKKFANEVGAIFMPTSAKNDSGIQALFDYIGKKILDPDFDFEADEKKKKLAYINKKKQEKEKKETEDKEIRKKGIKLDEQKTKDDKKGKKKCC